jgi:hypothetical protein
MNNNFNRQLPIQNSDDITSRSIQDQELQNELKGWNWGAFLLTWIWGIFHNVWWSLLAFVPFPPLSLVIAIMLGAQGNKLAWDNNKYPSLEEFKRSQKKWMIGGMIWLIISLIAIVIGVLAYVSYSNRVHGGSSLLPLLSQSTEPQLFVNYTYKLKSGVIRFKQRTGNYPTTMEQVISSKDVSVISALDGVTSIPIDSSGNKIRYCLNNGKAYFVYYIPLQSNQSQLVIRYMTAEGGSGSLSENDLKSYNCVRE